VDEISTPANVSFWLLSDILTGIQKRPLYPRKQTSKGVAVTIPFRESLTRLPSPDGWEVMPRRAIVGTKEKISALDQVPP
jgi:hypothetical protein